MVQRILMIEDDQRLAGMVVTYLSSNGYEVLHAASGKAGLELLRAESFALVLLDLMLPDADGLELCRRIRALPEPLASIPIVMLTAKGDPFDRVVGLELGADDYLPKPFSMLEMDVRIDAILRRVAYEHEVPGTARNEDPQLTFDEQRTDVSLNEQWADLTTTEYRVLETLVAHVDEVLTKAFLYQQVMHRAYSRHDRSLDMHVSRIRRKLQAIGYTAGRVETVRSTGYMLTRLQA